MIVTILAATFAAGVVSTVLWLNSMTKLDRISVMFRVIMKLRLHRYMKGKPEYVTMSNGFKMKVPNAMLKIVLEEVLRFKMRPDDVIVSSYSKSGTTWVQELAWLICNNADVKTAKTTRLMSRYGFLETVNGQWGGKGLQALQEELQNATMGKMIYVVRNPKDICVSLYHFLRAGAFSKESRAWSDFVREYFTGSMVYGLWFDHVEKYLQMYQERKNTMYIVSYESLHKDLKGEVIKLAKFLEKDLSDEQVDAVVNHCSFRSMTENDMTNYNGVNEKGLMNFKISKFMRKGVVGDWKNYFTINQNREYDKVFAERTKNWNLEFDFEPGNGF